MARTATKTRFEAEQEALRLLPPESEQGPAMRKLNPRQKAFVIAIVDLGYSKNHLKAAQAAGYQGTHDVVKVTAHWLYRNPLVVAAMQELARARFEAGTIAATSVVMEILEDTKAAPKDRLKAAEMVMDRGGLHSLSEHRVVVGQPEDRVAKLQRAVNLARELGIDPRSLLGNLADAAPEDIKVLEPPAPVEQGAAT